jgi:hypothetical protein
MQLQFGSLQGVFPVLINLNHDKYAVGRHKTAEENFVDVAGWRTFWIGTEFDQQSCTKGDNP